MLNSTKFWSFQIPRIQIQSNLALKFPWFLIQIPFRILKSSNKKSSSLINSLHVHILFEIVRAREGSFWSKQFEKYLNNLKRW
jgi:hypothetical protein